MLHPLATVWEPDEFLMVASCVSDRCSNRLGFLPNEVQRMGGKYRQCVNCGNADEGTAIFRCGKCGRVYCWSCRAGSGGTTGCPNCGDLVIAWSTKVLGRIETEEPEDEEPEDEENDEENDEDENDEGEEEEPEEEEDTEQEGEDDREQVAVRSHPHPQPPEPPAIVVARQLAAATTRGELAAIRQAFGDAMPAEEFAELYIPRAEAIETDALDALIRRIHGRSAEELKREFEQDRNRRIRDGMRDGWLELESYKLYEVAALIDRVWNQWDKGDLWLFQRWSYDLPWFTLLARRRLAEVKEDSSRAALAKIEPIESASSDQLSIFFAEHYLTSVAIEVVPRLMDRLSVYLAYRNYRRAPIGEALKRRYYQLLDAEHAKRTIWEKFLYRLILHKVDPRL